MGIEPVNLSIGSGIAEVELSTYTSFLINLRSRVMSLVLVFVTDSAELHIKQPRTKEAAKDARRNALGHSHFFTCDRLALRTDSDRTLERLFRTSRFCTGGSVLMKRPQPSRPNIVRYRDTWTQAWVSNGRSFNQGKGDFTCPNWQFVIVVLVNRRSTPNFR